MDVVQSLYFGSKLPSSSFLFFSLYLYVPDEGSLLPKYRDCTTSNDFESYIYIYIYSSYDETIQRKQSAQYRKRRAITVSEVSEVSVTLTIYIYIYIVFFHNLSTVDDII